MPAQDMYFMKLALREAKKGIGRTSPNPAVGAVVVKDGGIVGRGYHKKAGTPHAEVHALQSAGKKAKGGTIYITLEPCNHKGRTPPCTEAILKSGIERVVYGMDDPNPGVTGGGGTFLRAAGLHVRSGVLQATCEEINLPFIKHITTGLPWVILKAGMSLDGRIATRTGDSSWITNEKARMQVHRIRDRVDAILVGSGTVAADDPSLTARLPKGGGKDPLRIILDTRLSISPSAKVLTQDSGAGTVIFCGPQADPSKQTVLEARGARVTRVGLSETGGLDLAAVIAALGKEQITSVLVEGGGKIHGAFLRAGLADQGFFFIAPLLLGGDGVPVMDSLGVNTVGQAMHLKKIKTRRVADNILVEGRF